MPSNFSCAFARTYQTIPVFPVAPAVDGLLSQTMVQRVCTSSTPIELSVPPALMVLNTSSTSSARTVICLAGKQPGFQRQRRLSLYDDRSSMFDSKTCIPPNISNFSLSSSFSSMLPDSNTSSGSVAGSPDDVSVNIHMVKYRT